ncbi:MAG: DUF559 domain-containing protein [Blastochloris sp.]|nr:DUF559 domain-containing protein [Blastochloris sp.]
MKWHYNPQLKARARELRKKMTRGEILLWQQLKQKDLRGGQDFHRQKPLDQFIVDFFCPRLGLAIEVDGSTHNSRMDEDGIRQKRLESLGIHFLRFTERDVCTKLEAVLSVIDEWIRDHTAHLSPTLSSKKRSGTK